MKKFVLLIVLCLSVLFVSAKQQADSPPTKTEISIKRVSFTLRNNSLKSIPLIIPGVMKPNLSPRSNSGVTLKIGQKVLYRYKGKKRVLLIVDESYAGETLDVAKLLRQKKREIDKS